MMLPTIRVKQILAWADAHRKRNGEWPRRDDGAILGAPGETWLAVDTALHKGMRGLFGGSSLAQVLSEHRGVRNISRLPKLTQQQVLAWVDAHHERTGSWPTTKSGQIIEAPDETWSSVNFALSKGIRGLPASGSLPRFLAKHRGKLNPKALPKLPVRKILAWADAHHERTGKWPVHLSGAIPEAPGETWSGVHGALYVGYRGFAGGDSLFQLLVRHGRRAHRNNSRSSAR